MACSLDIVIVNWNSGRQLRDCLLSVERAVRDSVNLRRVVVVDNASSDGSADGLEDLGLPLVLVRNHKNAGFGAASNQGVCGSDADYLLFLNPDTCLYGDSLSRPLAFLEGQGATGVGICGIQLLDQEGKVGRTCVRFPTPMGFLVSMLALDRLAPRWFPSFFMTEWDHGEGRPVDHVIGAFLLVRRRVFEELGGFDERFFVYLEDVDLSLRARQAGWASYYLADVRAYHRGRGCSEQVKARRLHYQLQSRIQYAYKHFGAPAATLVTAATLLVEPFPRLVHNAVRGSFRNMMDTAVGYALLWRAVPRLLARALRGTGRVRRPPAGANTAQRPSRVDLIGTEGDGRCRMPSRREVC